MGLAKYYEDNIEIMLERQTAMESKTQDYLFNSKFVFTVPSSKISIINIKEEKNSFDEYKDEIIFCRDCGTSFLFTAKEQKQFDKKGWNNPKRCKRCRDFRSIRYLMYA